MFRIDFVAFFVAAILLLGAVYFWKKGKALEANPFLKIPSLATFSTRFQTFRERFSYIPDVLFACGLSSLFLAFIDPHLRLEEPFSSELPPKEGMAFYLALDKSGSMGKLVDREMRGGKWEAVTRFNRLQEASIQLIHEFPDDLIGVVAFARSVQVVAPLTLSHRQLEEKINRLEVVKDITRDGTSIGYAIYKTAHLIAATKALSQQDQNSGYVISNAFIIVITDGFQDPSILDKGNRLRAMELDEAAGFAKEKNIKVYIINIDPSFKEASFAPNRNEMQRIAESTGGKLYLAERMDDLYPVLKKVSEQEKNKIKQEESFSQYKKKVFYPYFIAIGLIFLALSIFFDETVWRKSL